MITRLVKKLTSIELRYHGKHKSPGHARRHAALGAAGLLVVGLAWAVVPGTARASDYATPVTAMFFYDDSFRHADDHYRPAASGFDSDNATDVAMQLAGIKGTGMQAVIASWWGRGQHGEATRFPVLHAAAAPLGLGVIPYYEPEGYANPTVATIQADLAHLGALADASPGSAVRIGGKRVIFVYNAGATGCGEVTKWKTATNGFADWYVNMKVFPGFASCFDQPSSWHQYGPAEREAVHLPWSFNISPGFWHHDETSPRLARDPAAWAQNVAHLKASPAQWKLVTSWNEWGEATSVEPSGSWQSGSGWGTYADELRRQLVGGAAPGPTTSPSGSPTSTSGPTPSPSSSTTSSPSPTPSSSTSTPGPSTSTTSSPSPTPTSPSPTPTGPSVTVMAAGDIVCDGCNGYGGSSGQDGYTAERLTKYGPDAILTLGDNQYESGSLGQYNAGWGRNTCAGPGNCDAWGQHRGSVYPAPGNHEWLTGNAQGYRDYFGSRLSSIGSDTASNNQMYYSWDLGAWHFVSLDSDCSKVGGCNAGNPMMTWLLADLAANNGRPTLVYYHHPSWSSGQHGNSSGHTYLKSVLVADRDVQLVLSGHDHDYERFQPMGANGPTLNGVRYFVVGTGGKNHYCDYSAVPGTQVFNCNTFGVLRLTLTATGYSWQFHNINEVGASGNTFTDAGSSTLR
jgi:hypothetical protein